MSFVKNFIHFPTVKNCQDLLTVDIARAKVKMTLFMARGVINYYLLACKCSHSSLLYVRS